MLKRSPINNCIFVHPVISVTGGVNYAKTDLDEKREEDHLSKTWQTVKTVESVEENNEAAKIRSQIKAMLKQVCAVFTNDIYICPTERYEELELIEAQITLMTTDFNLRAKTCRIKVMLIPITIQSSDERALNSLIRVVKEALSDLESAINSGDPSKIREVLPTIKQMGRVSDEKTSKALKELEEAARKQARALTKLIKDNDNVLDTNSAKDIIDTSLIDLVRNTLSLTEEVSTEDVKETSPADMSLFNE